MPRIQLFSDLHLDVSAIKEPVLAEGVDVVVVAGDTRQGALNGFEDLRLFIPESTPIVAVAGNHEHYNRCLPEVLAEARTAAPAYNVHFLEDAAAAIAGIRFVGATLWTDYDLYGEDRRGEAMDVARRGLNDHRRITWQKKPDWLRFRPQEALAIHRASREYLAAELAAPWDGPTIVVTHHAPHLRSVPAQYANDVLSAAYASDLSALMGDHGPDLWLHGHNHGSSDYRIGRTRVVANPHGYGNENPAFEPSLVLEVGS